jgi:hypothetical protein
MNKKMLIALADAIREANRYTNSKFNSQQIDTLADFCKAQNPAFKRDRWLSYIAGECGSNGGAIKATHTVFNCEACGTAKCKQK